MHDLQNRFKSPITFRSMKIYHWGVGLFLACSWKIPLVSFSSGHGMNEDQSPITPHSRVICDLQSFPPLKEKSQERESSASHR